MLEELRLNKFIVNIAKISLFLIFLAVGSCSHKRFVYHDSEINCPFLGRRVMVYNAYPQEVYDSILAQIETKNRKHTDEDYTIIKLKDGSSTHVRGIAPETMIKCQVYSVPHSHSRTYVRH